MIKIYKGKLRAVNITKLIVEDGVLKQFEYVRPIIREDILFYEGVRKKPISFDYGTVIPEESEAVEIVKQDLKSKAYPEKEPYPRCSFVNYEEIKPYMMVTRKQFRQMKKEYKEEREKKEQEIKRSR